MFRFSKRVITTLTLFALLITPLAALAHEGVTAGNYTIEYGWLDEPPVSGKENAIIINISGQAEAAQPATEGAVHLVGPADGETVTGASFEVNVSFEGLDEHAEGIHWHLYVDDKELVMAPVDQTALTVNGLSNGSHTLRVALAGSDHAEFGESGQAVITVEGSSDSGEPTVSGLDSAETHGHESDFHVDVSGLKLELVYGGQTIPLTLQPLHDGEAGQFTASFTPDRPGLYTLKITGKLAGDFGEAEVNAEVEPEEVEPGEAAPIAEGTETGASNLPIILTIGGVVVVGLALGVFVFMRRK
ncbi:MAG: hypothetical protein HYZ49_10800 [Chloroflexi bacterium]|nr:hypothetical protein [Chloroflexota bacterium]